MSTPGLRNLAVYVGLWLVNTLLGCLALAVANGRLWGFEPGGILEPSGASVSAALIVVGTALTGWLAANRPRLGREDISALVNEVGTIRVRMLLADLVHGGRQAAPGAVLTDAELDRLADRLYARIAARLTGDRS